MERGKSGQIEKGEWKEYEEKWKILVSLSEYYEDPEKEKKN